METLANSMLNRVYQVTEIHLDDETKKRLTDLGLMPGSEVAVVNHSGNNSIILLHNSRVALDRSILEKIAIRDISEDPSRWVSLDQMKPGDIGQIVSIHGTGAVRRRLMDMGLTKRTTVEVVKLAPLGDPIEITIRGYQLSLRKSEAELVVVQKKEDE